MKNVNHRDTFYPIPNVVHRKYSTIYDEVCSSTEHTADSGRGGEIFTKSDRPTQNIYSRAGASP